MDGYTVRIDELGKLIENLDTAAERITEANKQLRAESPSCFPDRVPDTRAGRADADLPDHERGQPG